MQDDLKENPDTGFLYITITRATKVQITATLFAHKSTGTNKSANYFPQEIHGFTVVKWRKKFISEFWVEVFFFFVVCVTKSGCSVSSAELRQWFSNIGMRRIPATCSPQKSADPLSCFLNSFLSQHIPSKGSLWIFGLCCSSWIAKELTGKQFLIAQGRIQESQNQGERTAFLSALRNCAKMKDLSLGGKLYDDIIQRGLLHKCSDALISMYARCGEVEKAEEIFENCPSRNAFTWTSLIAAYVEKGQPEDALICFKRMQREGLSPIPVTFTYILNACCSMGSVEEGGKIHNLIAQQGLLQLNPILGNAVVNMYAKCGALSKAQQVLEELSARNVNAWCALMSGYVNAGKGSEALSCYERMQHDGLSPDLVTFICLLKACGITKSIDKGEWIHHEVSQHGMLENNIELGTALVDMYAKCGALEKAQGVLKDLPQRNAITWSALIAGYAQQGDGAKAISCFEEMRQEGFYPDSVTFTCILNACGSIGAADKGEYIHDEILKRGLLENNIVLGNALVDMYAKCGAFKKAQQVLLKLVDRDVISWNALISGYSQHGKAEQALMCLMQMHDEGIFPNAITYTCILKACSSARAVEKGELMHEEIMRRGLLEKETVLGSALVEMYARCGVLAKARELLGKLSVQDLGSWLAVIAGYVRKCEFEEAFRCFEQMQCEGILPDQAILLYILNICGTIKAADKGVRIHKEVAKWGLLEDSILVGNALVDMYSKCDMTENARKVLEELLSRNVVTWNSLITGYAQCGDVEQAMKCLKEMQCDGIVPNSVTFTSILKACGAVGALNEGKEIHYEIARRDLLGSDVILGTSLVDMYAKCGALSNAQQVLQELPGRSIISWNAFIAGCIQKGDSELAFTAFKQLHEEGLSPNAATFSCMLSACNRSGQIKDAQSYFSDMRSKNGVSPDLEHYACMLDLLGRSGNVDKVMQVIQTLPTFHNGLWSVLLGACQKWGNMNVGKWAFQHAIQAEKHTAESNAIMSSTCATQSFFNE